MSMISFVVDDDEIFGTLLVKKLEELGIQSFYYNCPNKALEQIKVQEPQVIFLDYYMPEMNAKEFMIQFSERSLFSDRIVILVTSSNLDEESTELIRTLGVQSIMQKPIDISDLKNLLQAIQERTL